MMKRYKIDKWNPDTEIISEAARILQNGGLVAFPTETVYGLGANGLDGNAVKKIFTAKKRPADNPLILHVSKLGDAEKIAHLDERARKIMDEFFPAPLTLVLPAKSCVPDEVRAGLGTVAFRMPSHPVALALIEKARVPIAAPSANKSGRPSPTDADAVAEDLADDIDVLLDSGECDIGVESTVIDITSEKIFLLRPGGMPLRLIEDFLNSKLYAADEEQKKASPGTRHRHYAPNIPLLLWRKDIDKKIICNVPYSYIGLGEPDFFCEGQSKEKEKIIFSSVENYARGFFAALRKIEKSGVSCIIAEEPSSDGIGLALRDRLLRAACL